MSSRAAFGWPAEVTAVAGPSDDRDEEEPVIGRRFSWARRAVRRAAGVLPPPRDAAALALLRAARDLVRGREPAAPRSQPTPPRHADTSAASPAPGPAPGPTPPPEPFAPRPGPPLPRVEPLPEDLDWPTPPPFETGDFVRSIYDSGGLEAPVERFDVELLEQLNEEYADRPLVPRPRSFRPDAMHIDAQKRVRWAHNHVDLRDKRVLEIGCGNGVELWTMAQALGCDVDGVDVRQFTSWDALSGPRCRFTCADMAIDNPYPEDAFERVVSYTVWEHVRHPYALLRETYRVLEPGGLAWIRANLYAGPKASHRYREIHFPWPHLLFSDEVVRDWDAKHGRPPRGHSWVNRLSLHHYRNYFLDIGFRVRRLTVQETPIDEPFYRRFEDVLGRFPRTDLRQDFFLAVLEKPAS